jgi:hypothetical protein
MDNKNIIIGLKYMKNSGLKNTPDFNTDFESMIEIWSERLSDIYPQNFAKACKIIVNESVFFPALAEVRKKCIEIQDGKSKTGMEVWEEIRKGMLQVSHEYANPSDRTRFLKKIKCPVTKKTADLFDWRAYGNDNESNSGIHRAHFVKLYEGIKENIKFEYEKERFEKLEDQQGVKKIAANITKKIK